MAVSTTGPKIFLIGMMGSGKTYWSKKLAKKLKTPCYDLDNLIEIMEERSIAEIFEQSGEDFFRKEESKMLKLFKEKKSFILSCGGGTPCFFDNMEWMNKNGLTIWIDEPTEVLVDRLSLEKEHRPLISNLSQQELHSFISQRLGERKKFYEIASHRLTGINITETNLLNIVKNYA